MAFIFAQCEGVVTIACCRLPYGWSVSGRTVTMCTITCGSTSRTSRGTWRPSWRSASPASGRPAIPQVRCGAFTLNITDRFWTSASTLASYLSNSFLEGPAGNNYYKSDLNQGWCSATGPVAPENSLNLASPAQFPNAPTIAPQRHLKLTRKGVPWKNSCSVNIVSVYFPAEEQDKGTSNNFIELFLGEVETCRLLSIQIWKTEALFTHTVKVPYQRQLWSF